MGEIGQKRVFPKVIVDHWGCTNKCCEPIEPIDPCQIQVSSQKLTGGAPGRGRQVGRCSPKSAQFGAKNSLFSPKIAPERGQNAQTKGNGGYIPRAA